MLRRARISPLPLVTLLSSQTGHLTSPSSTGGDPLFTVRPFSPWVVSAVLISCNCHFENSCLSFKRCKTFLMGDPNCPRHPNTPFHMVDVDFHILSSEGVLGVWSTSCGPFGIESTKAMVESIHASSCAFMYCYITLTCSQF